MSGCRTIDGSVDGGGSFQLPNTIIYTSNDTYVSSDGVNYIEVYAIGGGGGGGGGATASGGGGGAAGNPSGAFFNPGTYSIEIGAGGGGSVATVDGTDGSQTVFGGVLIGFGGLGGDGSSTTPTRGGLTKAADASAEFTLGREAGSNPALDQGGNGGSNFFGTGGRSAFNTLGVAGEAGTGYGAGGAGATNSAAGGDGSTGAIIIIEHF